VYGLTDAGAAAVTEERRACKSNACAPVAATVRDCHRPVDVFPQMHDYTDKRFRERSLSCIVIEQGAREGDEPGVLPRD
jgi:hypothetical protein